MATYPYLVVGPTAILSLIGLMYGPDKTVPTPAEDWHNAIVDVIIPTYNEREKITLCLAALSKQTLHPRRITLIDDNSTDDTARYAAEFARQLGMELKVIKREVNEGKTPSIAYGAYESDSDVEFILDGDTILESENYIERLVQELYQGVGIASASGSVYPIEPIDYEALVEQTPKLKAFLKEHPEVKYKFASNWIELINEEVVMLYREMLYEFLQEFVYRSEMIFFGSIINPIGCAVAYRRKYLKDILEMHADTLGLDLTTSEDIFIGFNFVAQGYRNIQVKDVVAKTKEPPLTRLHRQVFLWSSSFFQSCYYMRAVLATPFKAFQLWLKHRREKRDPKYREAVNRRKIQEAYRQPFGEGYTALYGRPIGWYIFTSAFEKVVFPIVLLLLIIFRKWEILMLTLLAEVLLFSIANAAAARGGKRIKYFFDSFLITPLRYGILVFDVYVMFYFFFEIFVRKKGRWRK